MTAEQFQRDFRHFQTPFCQQAFETLALIECEEPVVVVRIDGGYSIMLKRAAESEIALGYSTEIVAS